MRAVRGEPVPHTPVWYMRQAGRSLPEYLRLREGVGMLESCMDPGLVTEITLQPVQRYGVDAAIFFSDIVLPLKAVGVDLDIVAGVGPVIDAGASAVQLFDSWAGALTPDDYRRSVMPHSAAVLAAVADLGVPRIHFGVGTGSLLGLMGEAGADVVGVDWRTPLASAIPLVGGRAIQGNVAPT